MHLDSAQDRVTHHDRAYHEKSSQLFDRPTHPKDMDVPAQEEKARQDEVAGDFKRKSNAYYS